MSSRTLFIGDVHGCAVELDLLLQLVQPTRGILVGDMFRKGPDNIGVWSLIQQWNLEASARSPASRAMGATTFCAGSASPPPKGETAQPKNNNAGTYVEGCWAKRAPCRIAFDRSCCHSCLALLGAKPALALKPRWRLISHVRCGPPSVR